MSEAPISARNSTRRAARLEAAIIAALGAGRVDVQDESARHAGHAGASAQGETHYAVRVVADAFRGMSRVARERAVHQAVAAEFATGLHALSLTLRTPEEDARDPVAQG